MFDKRELARAGIERREDHPNDWKHPDCAFRIRSLRCFHTHTYKHRESVPLLLAAYRAGQ
jgi:hypothetical protein